MSLSSNYNDALVFASRIHRTQKRKGAEVPYIAHLLAVSAITLEHGGSENEASAALLHDAVEDQGGAPMLEVIRSCFGEEVANIVTGCTDTDEVPKPPWRTRKERYIAHLREATYSVRLVAAADKLHNVRSVLADYRLIGDDLWKRFAGNRDGTLWFYRAVADTLQARTDPGEPRLNALVLELDRAVADLERAASIVCRQDSDSVRTRPGT